MSVSRANVSRSVPRSWQSRRPARHPGRKGLILAPKADTGVAQGYRECSVPRHECLQYGWKQLALYLWLGTAACSILHWIDAPVKLLIAIVDTAMRHSAPRCNLSKEEDARAYVKMN